MSDYNRGQLDLINSLLNLESLRTMSPEHVRLMLKIVRAVIQEENDDEPGLSRGKGSDVSADEVRGILK